MMKTAEPAMDMTKRLRNRLSLFGAAILLAPTLAYCAAAVPNHYAVFKSTDRGNSWTRADSGMREGSRINALGALATTWFAATDSGIFISQDEALSWQPATGPATSSGRVICLATLGRTAFAGTEGQGLLVSQDQGRTWTRNAAFLPRKVRCLFPHRGRIYAGTDGAGVFASHETGQVWDQLHAGLPAHAQVFCLSAVGDHLFAALYSNGLYAWKPQQGSWSKIGPVIPLTLATTGGTLVAGHNPGGLYWSSDLGISWSKGSASSGSPVEFGLPTESGELPDAAPVWVLAASDDLLLAGASTGIYISHDRGRTWVRARTGLPADSPGVSFLIHGGFVLAAVPFQSTRLH